LSLVGRGIINEVPSSIIEPAFAGNQRRWLEALDHGFAKLREELDSFGGSKPACADFARSDALVYSDEAMAVGVNGGTRR
jgi:hypothetical protein